MCVRHIIKLDEDARHRHRLHHDAPDRADDDTNDKTTSKWRFGGKCDTGI